MNPWYLVILCCVSLLVHGQTPNNTALPLFRVLYAEQSLRQSGDALKSLDGLGPDDVVTVRNGFLSMVHHTGFPVQISGDSIINIRALHSTIVESLNNKEGGDRFTIELLFTRDESEWRKNRRGYSITGAVHRPPGIDIIYPPVNSHRRLSFQDDLCVKWRTRLKGPFVVKIATLFDDPLGSWNVAGDSIYLPATELKEKLAGENLVTLQIRGSNGTSESFTLAKTNPKITLPFKCQISQPTAALMAGYYIEVNLDDMYLDDAEKYFALAAASSDYSFFGEMLRNFKERHKKK